MIQPQKVELLYRSDRNCRCRWLLSVPVKNMKTLLRSPLRNTLGHSWDCNDVNVHLRFLYGVFAASALFFSSCAKKTVPPPDSDITRMNGVSFFFFELTRYTSTGLSTQDITAFYTPLCRLPVSLLLRAVWSTDGRALYALERAQPSVIGEIDSTFCTYDLISSGQENADYGLAAALAPQSDEVEGIPSVEPPPELTQKNLPQQA